MEAVEVRAKHTVIAQCWLISAVPLDVLSVLGCAHLFCLVLGKDTRKRKLRQVEIPFIEPQDDFFYLSGKETVV